MKCGLSWGKKAITHSVTQFHKLVGKTVMKVWSQIYEKISYMSTKLLLAKSAKKKKKEKKKNMQTLADSGD